MNRAKIYPFPQANSIDKILSLVNIENPKNIKDEKYIRVYLDVKPREVQYYRSACQFLGLLDIEYNFTKQGESLRNLVGKHQIIELARIIFSIYDFSYAYLNDIDKWEDFADLIRDKYTLSEVTLKRRSESALAWIDYFDLKPASKNKHGIQLLMDPVISTVYISNLIYGFNIEDDEIKSIINSFKSDYSIFDVKQKVGELY